MRAVGNAEPARARRDHRRCWTRAISAMGRQRACSASTCVGETSSAKTDGPFRAAGGVIFSKNEIFASNVFISGRNGAIARVRVPAISGLDESSQILERHQ